MAYRLSTAEHYEIYIYIVFYTLYTPFSLSAFHFLKGMFALRLTVIKCQKLLFLVQVTSNENQRKRATLEVEVCKVEVWWYDDDDDVDDDGSRRSRL